MTDEKREVYPVEVAGVQRDLPLFEVAPGVKIALLNILGDTELVLAAAKALAEKLVAFNGEALVTPEAKSIPLIFALAIEMDLPWIVLRKNEKLYMGDALTAETMSITTGEAQTLYLDEKDRNLLNGKRVILVDDVISTGSTLQGMQLVGDRAKWQDIVALGHLPVFTSED